MTTRIHFQRLAITIITGEPTRSLETSFLKFSPLFHPLMFSSPPRQLTKSPFSSFVSFALPSLFRPESSPALSSTYSCIPCRMCTRHQRNLQVSHLLTFPFL